MRKKFKNEEKIFKKGKLCSWKVLKILYTEIQDSSKLGNNDYLKACYFVINMFNELTDEERDLQSIKNYISNILFDNTNNSNEIKCSIFNAKCFYDYLSESCFANRWWSIDR